MRHARESAIRGSTDGERGGGGHGLFHVNAFSVGGLQGLVQFLRPDDVVRGGKMRITYVHTQKCMQRCVCLCAYACVCAYLCVYERAREREVSWARSQAF